MHPYVHAQRTPDKPALIMASGTTLSYRELDERSNRFARMLRGHGLKPGDRIALLLENNPRFFELCWGAQRSGIFYVCISTYLNTADVAYIVQNSGTRMLVSSYAQREIATALVSLTPATGVRLMIDGTVDGYLPYESALDTYSPSRIDDETTGGDMLYSSGTTGRPKGVFVPPRDARIEAPTLVTELCLRLYSFDAQMCYLSPAPLYHAAPLRFSLTTQALGGSVVLMEHFDPERYLQLIQTWRVTHTQLVPTMFSRLLKLPADGRVRYDVSSLRVVIHAAAACPIPVKEQMIEWWGPIIWEYYSGTEANGFTSVDSQTWLQHKGTVGRALVGKLRICDPSGEVLPCGVPGLIYFAEGRHFEYHNDPVRTAQSRHPQHEDWTTLGDIGYVDDEDYLYLTDRRAHMINSGGVHVYPQGVENLLISHPLVLDAAVIGAPNDDFGEEVKAVIQLLRMEDAGPALAEELVAYCRANLSPIQCPRSVDFVDELPRTPTGKLLKRLVRDRYWEGHASKLV